MPDIERWGYAADNSVDAVKSNGVYSGVVSVTSQCGLGRHPLASQPSPEKETGL